MTQIFTKTVVGNPEELNQDPITGTNGSHPVGTGVGAASGGLAGAAVGMALGGPAASVIGATVGAVVGGLTGSSAAEAVNPTSEEIYWRETFIREPYVTKGRDFEYYAPGFRAGWEGRVRNDGRTFDLAEADLEAAYNLSKTEIDPKWVEVKPAARAAWDRVDQRITAIE